VYTVIRKVPDTEELQYGKLYQVRVDLEGIKQLDEFSTIEWNSLYDDLYVQLAQKDLHLEDLTVVDPFTLNVVVLYVGHSIIAIAIIAVIALSVGVFGLSIVSDSISEVQDLTEEMKPVALAGMGTIALVAIVVGLILFSRK